MIGTDTYEWDENMDKVIITDEKINQRTSMNI